MKRIKNTVKVWLTEGSGDSSGLPLDVHTASSLGYCSAISQALKDAPDSLNKANNGGWTAMMYAAYYGHVDTVIMLHSLGASLHSRSPRGCTPLMLAAMCGHANIVQALVKCGSLLELRDNRSWTAVFHAVNSKDSSTLMPLIDAGANVNAVDQEKGETPLLLAVRLQELSLVNILLMSGADPIMPDYTNTTPLMLAKKHQLTEILHLLAAASIKNLPLKKADALKLEDQLNSSQHFQNALEELLAGIGLSSYCQMFRDQGINLHIFMTLSDADLKECGVSKLGPRRKMTSLIARWHSKAPRLSREENAYADKLQVELQEMRHKHLITLKEREYLTKKLKQEQQLRTSTESLVVEARAKLYECYNRSFEVSDKLAHLYQRVLLADDGNNKTSNEILSWNYDKDHRTNSATLFNEFGGRDDNLLYLFNVDEIALPNDYKTRPPYLNAPKLGEPIKECLKVMKELLSVCDPNVPSPATNELESQRNSFSDPKDKTDYLALLNGKVAVKEHKNDKGSVKTTGNDHFHGLNQSNCSSCQTLECSQQTCRSRSTLDTVKSAHTDKSSSDYKNTLLTNSSGSVTSFCSNKVFSSAKTSHVPNTFPCHDNTDVDDNVDTEVHNSVNATTVKIMKVLEEKLLASDLKRLALETHKDKRLVQPSEENLYYIKY